MRQARFRQRNRFNSTSGVALVEFALVFPVLVLMLVGTFDLGWAVYVQNTIANAATEGARLGIISSNTDAAIRTRVKSTSQNLNLTDQQITIIPSGSRVSGGTIAVAVQFSYFPLTPIISQIVGTGGHIVLKSSATMDVE